MPYKVAKEEDINLLSRRLPWQPSHSPPTSTCQHNTESNQCMENDTLPKVWQGGSLADNLLRQTSSVVLLIHSDEGLKLDMSVFDSFMVANLPYLPCG